MAVLLVGVLVAVGCGDDDDAATDDGATAATENVVRVTEDDYSFVFDGTPEAGTVTFAVDNVGEEFHMLALCRMRAGTTVADVEQAAGSDDEAAFGEVCEEDANVDAAGGGVTPGGAYEVTVSGIAAGDYAAICFLPNEEGEPHFRLGMIGELSIAEGDETAEPDADVTYTATAEELDGPDEVDAGRTTVRVDREDDAPDEVLFLKLKDGKTADDVDAYFKVLDEGGFYEHAASPVDFLLFTFGSDDTRWFSLDLTEGRWAVAAEDSDEEGEQLDPDEDPHVIQFTVS